MVRSPAPLANHSLPGSTARLRTHPRWPEITRISFQGACHSGFGCCTFCRRTKLEDGRFLFSPGPLAGPPCPYPFAAPRSASAMDPSADEPPSLFSSADAAMPSIILTMWGSEGSSPSSLALGFFRRATIDAVAEACFAASAGGSSLTSSYSFLIRYFSPTRVACSNGFGGASEYCDFFCGGSEVFGIV